MDIEQLIKDNARRNADKKQAYDPLTGLGCCGDRFVLEVEDIYPRRFYLPVEMKKLHAVIMLEKHRSVRGAIGAMLGKGKGRSQKVESRNKKVEIRNRKSEVSNNKTEEISKELVDLFWLRLCEERYKYDFEFFAITNITIEDKLSADLIAFLLNPAQRMLLDEFEEKRKQGLQILVQVLKAKQMGFSTLTQMYMKWIQVIHRKNWNSVIVAHVRDAAINVRSMYERSIRMMSPIDGEKMTIKGFGGTQNIKEIPERGCRLTVGFATEPESVRSQNVKMVHFSEEAFYPATDGNNPELIEASIISSATDGAYTMIVRESTANGVGDYFHTQWLKAVDGESGYTPIFAPWFMISLYEIPFDGGYFQHNGRKKKGTVTDFINTLNEYELNLWNNYKTGNKICTLENLNWRRMKAATMPSESKMKQEYPSDPIEAFQDSGSPVFRAEDVEAMRKDCCMPVAVGTMVSQCDPSIAVLDKKRRKDILKNITFRPDADAMDAVLNGDVKLRKKAGQDKLWIWEYPDTESQISDRYVVSFDPQKGITDAADYGVIRVFDKYWMMYGEKPELVAGFYGHIDKDISIWIAAMVAKYYNNALLVVESNTYDSDVKEDDSEYIFDTIKDYYNNLYSRTPADKILEGVPAKYGWNTNRNTKPIIINHYNACLRERSYTERDEETLNEARYYEQKKDGSMGAKQGQHDDRIMATAIGLWVCYETPLPKKIKKRENASGGGKKIVY